MKTISAFNKKGGIGKTSSVISIGSELACLGYRVLLIDGDPSGNLSGFFSDSVGLQKLSPTLCDYFNGNADSDELIHNFHFQRFPGDRFVVHMACQSEPVSKTRYYTIVSSIDPDFPDDPDLDYMDIEPSEYSKLKLSRECTLSVISFGYADDSSQTITITDSDSDQDFIKQLLEEYQNAFDYVLIDCPPEDMAITRPILKACDYALVPTEPANDSIAGIASLLGMIEQIQDSSHPVKPLGIYFTKANMQESVTKKLIRRLRKGLQDEGLLFSTIIRRDSLQEKSRDAAMPLPILRPASTLAKEYKDLTNEILNKINTLDNGGQ